jgi:LPS-assembly lipoprotein
MIRRRLMIAVLLSPAALAGCGWEPLYANRETAQADADLRAIKVMPIPERIGQRLERALRQSFNPEGQSTPVKYVLSVTLQATVADLGIQSQGLGTRGEAQVYATYRLLNPANGALLQASTIHAGESFDIQANGYSTVVAQEDALVRASEEIRREIVTRLTLFLQKKALAAS